MSQVLLDKLTKKNKEFLHIATHQLLKDGKSDVEVKAILEEIIPNILESQGYPCPCPLRSTNLLGFFSHC